MNMIGHEHMGMNGDAMVVCRLSEPVQIAVVIVVREEAGTTIIAALNDMLRQSGPVRTSATGHAQECK